MHIFHNQEQTIFLLNYWKIKLKNQHFKSKTQRPTQFLIKELSKKEFFFI